jgi:hypothetical protein
VTRSGSAEGSWIPQLASHDEVHAQDDLAARSFSATLVRAPWRITTSPSAWSRPYAVRTVLMLTPRRRTVAAPRAGGPGMELPSAIIRARRWRSWPARGQVGPRMQTKP